MQALASISIKIVTEWIKAPNLHGTLIQTGMKSIFRRGALNCGVYQAPGEKVKGHEKVKMRFTLVFLH